MPRTNNYRISSISIPGWNRSLDYYEAMTNLRLSPLNLRLHELTSGDPCVPKGIVYNNRNRHKEHLLPSVACCSLWLVTGDLPLTLIAIDFIFHNSPHLLLNPFLAVQTVYPAPFSPIRQQFDSNLCNFASPNFPPCRNLAQRNPSLFVIGQDSRP